MGNTSKRKLKAHAHEGVKQYITYDGSNRMEYVYVADANAVDGDECMVTQYTYDGGSSRIQKMKESITTWDSSWDI